MGDEDIVLRLDSLGGEGDLFDGFFGGGEEGGGGVSGIDEGGELEEEGCFSAASLCVESYDLAWDEAVEEVIECGDTGVDSLVVFVWNLYGGE